MTRRQFMILTAAAAAATVSGCDKSEGDQIASAAPSTAPAAQPLPPGAVDVGPVGDYPDSKVYDGFREKGFFIIRRAQEVFALSSVCTHRGCKVRLQDDESFHCFCHGSRFDPDGHVVKGPARRDLPRLSVAEDGRGHLLIRSS